MSKNIATPPTNGSKYKLNLLGTRPLGDHRYNGLQADEGNKTPGNPYGRTRGLLCHLGQRDLSQRLQRCPLDSRLIILGMHWDRFEPQIKNPSCYCRSSIILLAYMRKTFILHLLVSFCPAQHFLTN